MEKGITVLVCQEGREKNAEVPSIMKGLGIRDNRGSVLGGRSKDLGVWKKGAPGAPGVAEEGELSKVRGGTPMNALRIEETKDLGTSGRADLV